MTGTGAKVDRRLAVAALVATVATLCLGAVAACGGADYSEDNAALADPLLANGHVITSLGSQNTEYCASGSCTLGSDGMITTYVVQITAEFDQMVAAFRSAYPGFAMGSDVCDDAACDDKYVLWATRADDSVELAYDDNMTGRLTVDAHAAESSNPASSPAP